MRVLKKLNYPFYALCIQGNQLGINQLHMDKVLAITPHQSKQNNLTTLNGIDVLDPRFGLKATWIATDQQQIATESGLTVCEPLTVLTTHLGDVIHNHLADLLTRSEIETLLNQPTISQLRDELIPTLLSFGQVQRVLHCLLQEKVSIRYLTNILEVLLEYAKSTQDPIQLTELVRARLALPICQKLLSNHNHLPVLTLAPHLEQKLSASIKHNQLALEPKLTERFITSLASQVEHMLAERKRPVLLCSSSLRRQIKQLTQRVIPHLTVLGMNEIPINIQVESFSVVT